MLLRLLDVTKNKRLPDTFLVKSNRLFYIRWIVVFQETISFGDVVFFGFSALTFGI